jgi:hypothetical protein
VASLEDQAQKFANDLTATVYAVVGETCSPFVARLLSRKGVDHFAVRQRPLTGVPLTIDASHAVTLKVSFTCALDEAKRHLRVTTSSFALHYGREAAGEPIFHYDYDRNITAGLPRSHLQVSDGGAPSNLGALLYVGGSATRRGRRRQQEIARSGREPRQGDFHFPLGGDRFRPSLEDVLQVLVDELGVQAQPGWREALKAGRKKWRDTQLRAAVRDNPRTAAEALVEEFGYTVTPPDGEHVQEPQDHQLVKL